MLPEHRTRRLRVLAAELLDHRDSALFEHVHVPCWTGSEVAIPRFKVGEGWVIGQDSMPWRSRVLQITGYEPQDLVDRTLYHYVHTQDLMSLRLAHQIRKCRKSPSSLKWMVAWSML